jgi:hypothetical protein
MKIASGAATPTAPTITIQPADRTVTVGQTATFSVSASGTAPLQYQCGRTASTSPGGGGGGRGGGGGGGGGWGGYISFV